MSFLVRRAARAVVFSAPPSRSFHSSVLSLAEAAKASATAVQPELVLNFAVPNRTLVSKKQVKRVTVPGRDGALGLERNSPPTLSELRPGVVRVDFADGATEDFFVPGGFLFKHASNVVDVSAPEGFKLDTIDVDALRAANIETAKKVAAATPGSRAHAEAKIEAEVYKILSQSLKI